MTPPHASAASLLGVKLTPVARDAILVALLAIASGALLVALVIADNLGMGPRRRLARRAQREQLL